MEAQKKAVLTLENLHKLDLEAINTDCRCFEAEYETEAQILEGISDKLHEIGCWPGVVYVEKEGVKYEVSTVILRACYTKGHLSELEAVQYAFHPRNIVSVK